MGDSIIPPVPNMSIKKYGGNLETCLTVEFSAHLWPISVVDLSLSESELLFWFKAAGRCVQQ